MDDIENKTYRTESLYPNDSEIPTMNKNVTRVTRPAPLPQLELTVRVISRLGAYVVL